MTTPAHIHRPAVARIEEPEGWDDIERADDVTPPRQITNASYGTGTYRTPPDNARQTRNKEILSWGNRT